jgi:hypothetical protein
MKMHPVEALRQYFDFDTPGLIERGWIKAVPWVVLTDKGKKTVEEIMEKEYGIRKSNT